MNTPKLPSAVTPLLAALTALAAPSVARAGETDLSGVRASLSLRSLFGVLSPAEGAVVTGLLVFAVGCVVAVVVARRIERASDEREAREAADEERSVHFGAAPEPFYTYEEMLSGEYRGFRSSHRVRAASSGSVRAASSGSVHAASSAAVAVLATPTESAPAVPADRASETQVMGEAERAAVRAPRKAPVTLVDPLPRGADPDRTQELSRLSPAVEVPAVPSVRARTMLPPAAPAIRPIPISPPRGMAPANVSELAFDEPGTEADLPSFPLDTHHISTSFQSEIRLVGAPRNGEQARQLNPDLDVAQTQAFVLVRSS
ncbi:MAG TPA: hypothetical protein PLR99_29390 [Polyangiaceae bacterium]|nr:hypothetical protein [Polyangiaceae bacterium]